MAVTPVWSRSRGSFAEAAELVDLSVAAAQAAGRLQRAAFGRPVACWEKAPGSYVSEVDLRSQELIYRRLDGLDGIGFVSEERPGVVSGSAWVVDPLDGTANFVRGLPSFAVSIALVHDGCPSIGVVHEPLRGETYVAVRGRGAWRGSRRLRVAARRPRAAICATGVPRSSALRARHGATLTRVLRQIDDVRRVSPISLELAYVASGVLDGCFELELALWDTAAGVLLVREAGGIVSDWDGDPDAWSQSGAVLVASTPLLHRTLLAATRRGDGAGTLLSKG